jgi:hypothetical protein
MKPTTLRILAIPLLAAAVACGAPTTQEETSASQKRSTASLPTVKLLRAHSKLYYGYGTHHMLDYLVRVENLAYHKEVVVHRTDGNGNWSDVALHYIGPAEDGYELWGGNDELDYHPDRPTVELAVRYTVGGQTYWDNNGGFGQNYTIGNDDRSLLTEANVMVYKARRCRAGGVNGYIDVRNLGNPKSVKVVYTYDNWTTHHDVDAHWLSGPNAHGIEQWRYEIPNVSDPWALRFAVSYSVSGQTYWDNNFAHRRDYKLQNLPFQPTGLMSMTCCSELTATGAGSRTFCSL